MAVACPLNPNQAGGTLDLSPAIRGVVDFAKAIPGFHVLSQDDQVTLLKVGRSLVRFCFSRFEFGLDTISV